MTSLIRELPAPLLVAITSGRCIPIVGSGLSRNAIVPTGSAMPLWPELGASLARELKEYEPNGALDAISAYEREYSRVALVEALTRALLVGTAQPGSVHRAFCRIPFDLVITTNFEFLLEEGYASVRRYCRPILNEDELSIDATAPRVDLLKLHGDLHHPDRLIATEDDYDSFVARYPIIATFVGNLLIRKTALFVGYSLEDSDFRQIWLLIKQRLGRMRRMAYALTVGAAPHAIARFERRGVKVINLPGKPGDYAARLEQLFDELAEAWKRAIPHESIVTEEDPLAEFVAPRGSPTRLCFFSLPASLVSIYRELAFPVAQAEGFVPIAATDVLAPGDSITAKVGALLDRSQLVVFDLSSEAVVRELELALAKTFESASVGERRKRMLIVVPVDRNSEGLPEGATIVRRPDSFYEADSDFWACVRQFFHEAAVLLNPEYESEPQRLLEENHPEAAVVAAYTLFEKELRLYTQRRGLVDGPRPRLVNPVQGAREVLTEAEWMELRRIAEMRNRIVHGMDLAVNKKAITQAVAFLLGVASQLRSR